MSAGSAEDFRNEGQSGCKEGVTLWIMVGGIYCVMCNFENVDIDVVRGRSGDMGVRDSGAWAPDLSSGVVLSMGRATQHPCFSQAEPSLGVALTQAKRFHDCRQSEGIAAILELARAQAAFARKANAAWKQVGRVRRVAVR